jgi:hypothetical protein
VKSDTHSSFGRLAVKSRATRSSGQTTEASGIVVFTFLPRITPQSPIWRIRRATVQRAIFTFSRRSSFQTFFAP